jgi:phosphocarrier protein HPr
MTKKEAILSIPKGIHLRIAGSLARKAGEFESEIFLEYNNMNVNCKSVMGVATLGAMTGDKIIVVAKGIDESRACLSICAFLENDTHDKTDIEIFDKYISGASWMDTEKNIYIVRGFHQEWVDKKGDVLDGIKSVNEVIEKLDWIDIMIYKDNSVEFHVKDLGDSVLDRIKFFLSELNINWKSAHIFTSQKESIYVQIDKEIFDKNNGDLKTLLKEQKLITQYY